MQKTVELNSQDRSPNLRSEDKKYHSQDPIRVEALIFLQDPCQLNEQLMEHRNRSENEEKEHFINM